MKEFTENLLITCNNIAYKMQEESQKRNLSISQQECFEMAKKIVLKSLEASIDNAKSDNI